MQPTSRVVGAFEGANNASSEPPDVFCGLASLIVEGRIPRNDGRGYGEGPHVPQTASKSLISRHDLPGRPGTQTLFMWIPYRLAVHLQNLAFRQCRRQRGLQHQRT